MSPTDPNVQLILDEVRKQKGQLDSMNVLLQHLEQANNSGDPKAVSQILSELQANGQELTDAINANPDPTATAQAPTA